MARKKKQEQEEPEDNDRWLVSYADFITLLFAFFTVLYATAEKDKEKTKEFEKSLRQYLVKAAGPAGLGSAKKGVGEGSKFNSPIKPPIPTYPKASPQTRKIKQIVETFIQTQFSPKAADKLFFTIAATDHGVKISMSATELFQEDSDRFRRSAVEAVKKMGRLVKKVGEPVIVQSHTAEDSIDSQQFQTHWELASARSTHFVHYLAEVHEISPSKLSAVSYGKHRPIVSEDSESRNSRLNLLIVVEDPPL